MYCILLVSFQESECIDRNVRRVDDTNHATLAMPALRAVEPYGCRCIGNSVCKGPVGDRLSALSWNVTRPEAIVHRFARLSECCLSNAVILGPKPESNGVALGGLDAVWHENILAIFGANSNLVVGRKSGASESSSSEEG